MLKTILVIDDDPNLCNMMRLVLAQSGYNALAATNGTEGLQLLCKYWPDLVLLDVMMPDMDGWEVCQHIREFSTVPIIFLTADHAEQVKGLNLGADDYIVKPFHRPALVARINAILRRAHMPVAQKTALLCYDDGNLVINTATHRVTICGQTVDMTPAEYRLLLCLVQQPNRVLTPEQIYDAIWSADTDVQPTSVTWYIWRLRGKIERDPARPRLILTEPGVGYRFATS